MKNMMKLSVLVVSILALSVGASATTITLVSSPATTNYIGSVTTTDAPAANTTFDISQEASGSGTAVVAVTNPGGWANAIAGSEWVSNNAISGPSGTDYFDPYGYYTYTETFTVTGEAKIASGSLSVMADDTATILLNGTVLADYESTSDDSHCANTVPVGQGISCGGGYTISLAGLNLVHGVNTLTIVDLQAGTGGQGDAAGIDYSGIITTAPEPGTSALLGSGLLGLLFLARRHVKSCAIHNA